MRRDTTPPGGEKSLLGERLGDILFRVPHTFLSDLLSEETSPPVSMKSKTTGLNFMVSVGRAIEAGGDNALAKLLQASQDLVSHASIFHTQRQFRLDGLHTNLCI